MTLAGFIAARIAEDESEAKAAAPGPWFYNSYNAVFSKPMLEPYEDLEPGEHTWERHGHCPACGDDWWPEESAKHLPASQGQGCMEFTTEYNADPVVASVRPHHGDTATGVRTKDAAHIARHNPARVLAQCAAYRAILASHSPVDVCAAHDPATLENEDCDTLRALASIWSDSATQGGAHTARRILDALPEETS